MTIKSIPQNTVDEISRVTWRLNQLHGDKNKLIRKDLNEDDRKTLKKVQDEPKARNEGKTAEEKLLLCMRHESQKVVHRRKD